MNNDDRKRIDQLEKRIDEIEKIQILLIRFGFSLQRFHKFDDALLEQPLLEDGIENIKQELKRWYKKLKK